MFVLDSRLERDTIFIGDLDLCTVRLMNDARYPWVILIPKRADICEIYQLTLAEQEQLQRESCFIAQQLAQLVSADKMNVAALGNIVKQLHVHHVARFKSDEAWPNPVWGKGAAVPYSAEEAETVIEQLKVKLASF